MTQPDNTPTAGLFCECHAQPIKREAKAPFLRVLRDPYECPVNRQPCQAAILIAPH